MDSRRLSCYVLLILLAAVFLLPIWSMFVTSVTPEGLIFSQGSGLWPSHPSWVNFQAAFSQYPYGNWYSNSLISSIFFTIGQLFSCSFAAFALAHFPFRGRGIVMLFILATMMLPFQAVMIPLFLLFNQLHWINTLMPLIVPAFFGDISGAVGIFLLRQAFMQVPYEFAEAAYVEGARPFQVYRHVMMPMIKPYLVVFAVLSFLTCWNDFIRPLVFITAAPRTTVTGGLSFFQTQFNVEWGLVMASTLLAVVPPLIIYIFGQRYLTEVNLGSGLKG